MSDRTNWRNDWKSSGFFSIFSNETREGVVAAGSISGIYMFFSGLWILLSDRVLGFLVKDPETITRWSIVKGFLFVAVTGALLFIS